MQMEVSSPSFSFHSLVPETYAEHYQVLDFQPTQEMEVSELDNIEDISHGAEGDLQMVFYGEPSPCNLEEISPTELLIEKAEIGSLTVGAHEYHQT